MTILTTNVRKSPEPVKEPGRYTIKSVSEIRNTKYGQVIDLTVLNSAGEERLLSIAYSLEVSEQSNLGRLIKAFGSDNALWPKKKLDIDIDADKRRTVKPVAK